MSARLALLRDETVAAVHRLIFADAYPAALDAARGLSDEALAAAATGDDCDALIDATAEACYGSEALEQWVRVRGRARRIRPLFDLAEAFEEFGIGWEQGITLSQVRVADLVELILWEIEHGAGPISDAWSDARREAEATAARDALKERNEETPAATGVKTRK
jgi:hypothetical protein